MNFHSPKLKVLIISLGFVLVILSGIDSNLEVRNQTNSKSQFVDEFLEPDHEVKNIPHKNYFYASLGITALEISENGILTLGISILSIFIIAEFSIVVKKVRKPSNSEKTSQNLSTNYLNEKTHEEVVLDIVQEYLSNNRFLDIDKIIPYITSRLPNNSNGLNLNGIEKILNSLIRQNIVVIGSKYTRDNVLQNSNRAIIFKTILNNPGIHFMMLVNLLGMSIFLVKWHLNMLLKFNLIKKKKVENREIYFDLKCTPHEAERSHFFNRSRTQKIINFLKTNTDGCSKYRMVNNLKIHPNTITKYLGKLEEYGFLFKTEISKKIQYFLKKSYFMSI